MLVRRHPARRVRLTAAGTYPAVGDVASGALPAVLASHGVDKADAVDLVLAGFAELPGIRTFRPGCTGSTPPVSGSSP